MRQDIEVEIESVRADRITPGECSLRRGWSTDSLGNTNINAEGNIQRWEDGELPQPDWVPPDSHLVLPLGCCSLRILSLGPSILSAEELSFKPDWTLGGPFGHLLPHLPPGC